MTDTITTQPTGVGKTQPVGANVVTQPPLPPGYVSVPQQRNGNLPPGYGSLQPQQGYGNPPPGYGPLQPQQGYGNPPPGYSPPQPQQGYGHLLPGYGPQQVQWMTKPEGDPRCPPGLEYLTMLDQILLNQMIEPLELITGYETENRYRVLNSMGQQCYFLIEKSNMLDRQMYNSSRGFIMHVTDNMGQEVMMFSRQNTTCGNCWCCACNDCGTELTVEAPVGQMIGKLKLKGNCCSVGFDVLTPSDEVMLNIEGPGCICCKCCTDIEFVVRGGDGGDVGKIQRKWSGLAQESLTDATNFGITFKQDLDVKTKAVLLGATILVDFVFFEYGNNNNRHHRHY